MKKAKIYPVCPALYYWDENRECGHDFICCFHCRDRKSCDRNGCATGKAMNHPRICKHYPVFDDEAKTIYTFSCIMKTNGKSWNSFSELSKAIENYVLEKRKKMRWKEPER